MKNNFHSFIGAVAFLLVGTNLSSQNSGAGYLTQDGAWCWFSDPRAIYVDGTVVTGWVKKDGTI